MDEQTMPTLEELRGVIAHRKYVYDSHLMDMPVNWENIAAMVSGIADAQNEYIDALEADHTAQQQRIDALTTALVEIWGITHDPSVERKIMAVMNMMASELTDAYAALHAADDRRE